MTKRISFLPWLVWGLAAFFVLYQFLLQASVSVMVPCLKQAFHINATGIGLLSSSFFYTYLIMQIPSGILTDRFGPRKVLSFSVIITAIACFLFAWTRVLSAAEASRMLMGFVTAPAVVCAFSLAARWFPSRYFALLVGLTEMLGLMGGAIGEVFLAHCIAGPLGWRGSLIICGIVGVVLAILIWIFIYDKPKTDLPTFPKMGGKDLWRHILQALTTGQVWLAGLYCGLMFTVINGFASLWAVPFLIHSYHFGLEKAASASALIFLGGALSSPFWGWASNQIGRRCLLMYVGASLAVIVGIILFYATLAAWQIYITLFLFGAFAGTYVMPFAVVSDMVKPEVKSTALGFTNMMGILIGAPILQPLMGYIVQTTNGNYQKAFLPLLICLAIAFVLVFFIKETYCKSLCTEG